MFACHADVLSPDKHSTPFRLYSALFSGLITLLYNILIPQVSIPYGIQNAISLQLMQEEMPSSSVFNKAQQIIYRMMENDSMPRFLSSADVKVSKCVLRRSRRRTRSYHHNHNNNKDVNDTTPLKGLLTRLRRLSQLCFSSKEDKVVFDVK